MEEAIKLINNQLFYDKPMLRAMENKFKSEISSEGF